MTRVIPTSLMCVALAALTACGGGSSDKAVVQPPPPPPSDMPRAPRISDANVIAGRNLFTRVDGYVDTGNLAILPSGSARYSGRAVTGMTVVGATDIDGMYGNVNLTAELGGGDRLTGSITNLHTLDGNRPIEQLTGQININGTLADFNKNIDANLSGTVGGVFGDGQADNLTVSGTMIGELQAERTGTVLFVPTFDETAAMAGSMSGTMGGNETVTFDGNWAVERN